MRLSRIITGLFVADSEDAWLKGCDARSDCTSRAECHADMRDTLTSLDLRDMAFEESHKQRLMPTSKTFFTACTVGYHSLQSRAATSIKCGI